MPCEIGIEDFDAMASALETLVRGLVNAVENELVPRERALSIIRHFLDQLVAVDEISMKVQEAFEDDDVTPDYVRLAGAAG